MTTGRVEWIHIAPAEGAPVRSVERIRALGGIGLDGDRHGLPPAGNASPHRDNDLTLVEAEAIEAVAADGLILAPGETRRNVTTRGVRLNELVGRRFRLGAVGCQGLELAEPCRRLEQLSGKALIRPLVHRGGLRARILDDGEIAVGDPILVLEAAAGASTAAAEAAGASAATPEATRQRP